MNPIVITVIVLGLISGKKSFVKTSEISDCQKAGNMVNECLKEFEIFFAWDGVIAPTLKDDLGNTTCLLSNITCFDEWLLKESNCSFVKGFYKTKTNYTIYCTSRGLAVSKLDLSTTCGTFSKTLQKSTEIFCRLNSSLSCRSGSDYWDLTGINVLSPLYNACIHLNETASTQLPLLLNPISPESITAVVVIVCLGIIIILAGFFFWPKCHNPKAGWLPKKKLVEMNTDTIGKRSDHAGTNNFRTSSNA